MRISTKWIRGDYSSVRNTCQYNLSAGKGFYLFIYFGEGLLKHDSELRVSQERADLMKLQYCSDEEFLSDHDSNSSSSTVREVRSQKGHL